MDLKIYLSAAPKTKFDEQKSSFGIAQKLLIPQITVLWKDTNINVPTSANKLFIVFGFMNLLLNITTYNCKYCSTQTSLQNLHAFKYKCKNFSANFVLRMNSLLNCNCNYCSTKSSLQNLHDIFMNIVPT